MQLEKYHALGNDYLVYDTQLNKKTLNEEQIKLLCDRNFGFGSDGILYGPILEGNSIRVRIFNPDGGEAEKSGNGVRIFAKYLKDFGYIKERRFTLLTLGGEVEVEYLNDEGNMMRVLMGTTTFVSTQIPAIGEEREIIDEDMVFHNQTYRVTCVSIGNPHCVIPMEHISKEKALELGSYVEQAPYFPKRINMQLLEVMDRSNIKIEIYERGAGYTLASGSSSCAAAAAAYRLGLIHNQVTVHMPGGELFIEITPSYQVYMTGEVKRIGTFVLSEAFYQELVRL